MHRPVKAATPVKSEKFDEVSFDIFPIKYVTVAMQIADNEDDFTDKIIEFRDDGWPEDWDEDIQEVFDENGWNLLHYSIMKGYGSAVTVLIEDLEFGKYSSMLCVIIQNYVFIIITVLELLIILIQLLLLDIDKMTKDKKTSLELALQKCYDCLEDDDEKMKQYFNIAIALVESRAKVDEERVMHLAINFPSILTRILGQHPEYYKPDHEDDSSVLTQAIKSGLHYSLKRMGFIELMLRKNADAIIERLIDSDPNFVESIESRNTADETALHSAVKVGNEKIVQKLMNSGLVFLLSLCVCLSVCVCVCV